MKITDIKGAFTLNNGVEMPYFGLGVFKTKEGDEVINAVNWALEAGYRHIDTAALYGNENGVGRAIQHSGIDRKEIFVTTKVWNTDQGYETTLKAFDRSLNKLGLDYLDLYLIHWPKGPRSIETWKAMEHLYNEGRVRAIGVSNFLKHQLEELLPHTTVTPMVNQMEFHPYLIQQSLVDFCQSKRIVYEAWSPIMQGRVTDIQVLREIGEKYGKSPVQVVLRWDLQKGVVTIPKSSNKERIQSNADIFDFELSPEDINVIDRLDRSERIGPDPDNFNF